jgi:hypothetical protein
MEATSPSETSVLTRSTQHHTFFLLVYFSYWFIFPTLKMEATRSSEASVPTISTRRHIPEGGILPDCMTSLRARQRFICMWRHTRPYVSVSPSALHISCGRRWDGLDKVGQTVTSQRMRKQITLETWHDALNEAEHRLRSFSMSLWGCILQGRNSPST